MFTFHPVGRSKDHYYKSSTTAREKVAKLNGFMLSCASMNPHSTVIDVKLYPLIEMFVVLLL